MDAQIIFKIEIKNCNAPGVDFLTLTVQSGDLKNAERKEPRELLKFSPSYMAEDMAVNFVAAIIKQKLEWLMKSAAAGEI